MNTRRGRKGLDRRTKEGKMRKKRDMEEEEKEGSGRGGGGRLLYIPFIYLFS